MRKKGGKRAGKEGRDRDREKRGSMSKQKRNGEAMYFDTFFF